MKIYKIIFWALLLLVPCSLSAGVKSSRSTASANSNVMDATIDPSINTDHLGVWSGYLAELFSPAQYTIEDSSLGIAGVRDLYYNSITYNGERKRVFAYYSNPDILAGNETNTDASYPAVVCVHGGGGKAYANWVKIWAARGYAALAMDWRGYGPYSPAYPTDDDRLDGGFVETANRKTPYFALNEDISNEWFFQAVGDVICAHSVLLSMPEVDRERTAITGISWGGILTTLVSGLDSRFKAAVPVYGCGYIYESNGLVSAMEGRKTTAVYERWINDYDPSLHVKWSEMPMLFIVGTNDANFYLDQWQKTTTLPKGSINRSVRLNMTHGHPAGWSPEEIYKFIGESLGVVATSTTPTFEDIETTDTQVSCRINGYVSGDRIYLLHTTSDVVSHEAAWEESELTADESGNVTAPLGADYKQWIIGIEQAADKSNFTSEVFFRLD